MQADLRSIPSEISITRLVISSAKKWNLVHQKNLFSRTEECVIFQGVLLCWNLVLRRNSTCTVLYLLFDFEGFSTLIANAETFSCKYILTELSFYIMRFVK